MWIRLLFFKIELHTQLISAKLISTKLKIETLKSTNMKNLKLIILAGMVILSNGTFAQMGITSYSFYALGINTSQNRTVSAELKTFTNRYI